MPLAECPCQCAINQCGKTNLISSLFTHTNCSRTRINAHSLHRHRLHTWIVDQNEPVNIPLDAHRHADIMCMPKLEIVVALSVTHTRSSDAHKYYEVTAFRLLTKCENIWQIDQWIILRLLLTCEWSEEPLRSVNILQADSRRKFTDNVCILRTIRKWCRICRWQINKIFHIW